MPNLSETLQSFWLHSFNFASEEQSKNLNFQGFLPLKEGLVAFFNETGAPTFTKYVTEQGIIKPNLVALLPFYCRKITLKMLNF